MKSREDTNMCGEVEMIENVGEYVVPVDPVDGLQCDSCQ
jgi:hypothetical protein